MKGRERSHEAAFETNYSDSQVVSTASTQAWLDDVLRPIADPAPRSLHKGLGRSMAPLRPCPAVPGEVTNE